MPNSQTLTFLEALYSRLRIPFKLEIRAISPTDGTPVSHFYNSPNEVDLAVVSDDNRTHDVYFGINPRPLTEAKKQEDITHIVCLWADVDAKEFEGGKDEALETIRRFPLRPTALIDSGHGYHCYWLLSQPLVVDETTTDSFKHVMSGIAKALTADRAVFNLDRILRLPGTMNIKREPHASCVVMEMHPERVYDFADLLEKYYDAEWKKPKEPLGEIPTFGTLELIVSNRNVTQAKKDAKKLKISRRIKNLILTGQLKTEGDHTRSGRDFSIMCALVRAGYNRATIESVFFNPFLPCSNRLIGDRSDFEWDLRRAVEKVAEDAKIGTGHAAHISSIRDTEFMGSDEKRQMIMAYIVKVVADTCTFLFDENTKDYYLYARETKEMIKVDPKEIDFAIFLKQIFNTPDTELREIATNIISAISLQGDKVTLRRVSYFDEDSLTLYVDNNDNGIWL